MHMDRRLTWKKHIFTKRKQLGLKLSKMYWLMEKRSQLNLSNKILVYKSVIKYNQCVLPVVTYGKTNVALKHILKNSNRRPFVLSQMHRDTYPMNT
ncbi:unnamed protein product [Diabrotica balteata]|uniref:Uncharacterized protein n=1 Tax=Diabrotica balteata TaxID=107213 RepID=A0A9N9XHE9_DIABA|nr:unnamed protein product [Diabrotica balteata]